MTEEKKGPGVDVEQIASVLRYVAECARNRTIAPLVLGWCYGTIETIHREFPELEHLKVRNE